LIVLGALLWRDVRVNRRAGIAVAGTFVAFVVLALIVVTTTPALRGQFKNLTQLGGKGTVTVRLELDRAAIRMAADRPVVGFGPDTFRTAFQDHQTPRFVKLFGPRQIANGGHNLLLNQLATQGIIGLAALMWLLVTVFRDGWRATRAGDSIEQRLLVAALTTAIVAYVVQATFNVQQVGLTTVFWVLVGMVGMAALGDHAEAPVPQAVTAPSHSIAPRRVALAVPIVAVSAFLALTAARPYRADGQMLAAQRLSAAKDYLGGRAKAERAAALYAWEPRYLGGIAELSTRAATRPGTTSTQYLRDAKRAYERALAVEPRNAPFLQNYGEVLAALGDRAGARRALDRAVAVNPFNPGLRAARSALG
jgi:hypothetical protein